jgi:hypothetical protein
MEDKKAKPSLFFATALESAYQTNLITFEDIVRHIKSSLPRGLATLVKIHNPQVILGPFYAQWNGKKEDNLVLFEEATHGYERLFAQMLKDIRESDIPAVLENLIKNKVITWDNLVIAFRKEIPACVKEILQRAEAIKEEDEKDAEKTSQVLVEKISTGKTTEVKSKEEKSEIVVD